MEPVNRRVVRGQHRNGLDTIMDNNIKSKEVLLMMDQVMKQMLDLGQASLPEHQFQAFRKITMDFFADGKRCLTRRDKGRCGVSEQKAKGVVTMSG